MNDRIENLIRIIRDEFSKKYDRNHTPSIMINYDYENTFDVSIVFGSKEISRCIGVTSLEKALYNCLIQLNGNLY